MLRRYGFRRILPVLHLFLYVMLVVLGALTYQHGQQQQQAEVIPTALQESSPPFKPTIVIEPFEWRFAILLDFPAIAAGALLLTITSRHVSELYLLLLSTPFVPITWTLLGRWLDYQLRILPRPPRNMTRLVFSSLGIAVACLMLAMVIVSASKSHSTSEASAWGTLYLVSWAAIILTTSLTSALRRTP